MMPERPQPVALLRYSREFIEREMHLFLGKLIRGRIAGVDEGRPRLNFGSFSIPLESEIEFTEGEIATFRVINLQRDLLTLELVTKEATGKTVTDESISAKVKSLLSELNLPVDEEHTTAVSNLLKAGFAADGRNIRIAVSLKGDPSGKDTRAEVLRWFLVKGQDIPKGILPSVRRYLDALPTGEASQLRQAVENGLQGLKDIAGRIGVLRGNDPFAVDLKVAADRANRLSQPIVSDSPEELASTYPGAASAKIGIETAIARALNAFIPKYISSMHPNDNLRVVFEEFASAAKEYIASLTSTAVQGKTPGNITVPTGQSQPTGQTEVLQPLPIEVLPVLLEYLLADPSVSGALKEMLQAFSGYLNQLVRPQGTADTALPAGADARAVQNNVAINLGRLINAISEELHKPEETIARDALTTLLDAAQATASRNEGARVADWIMNPSRPGAENLPVVGFTTSHGGKGTVTLYPGVKRRGEGREGKDEKPAGGRVVYEGDGVGRIEIGLEYSEDELSAVFVVGREDVRDDIQAGIPELAQNLDARGVKVKLMRCLVRIKEILQGKAKVDEKFPSKGLDLKA